jgi:ABC-type sugar transport system ATPase subunit
MVRQPKAYLMDEPLSDLDAQLRSTARTEIVELHRSIGATTVYVTHDQAEAMTMGDRIAVMAEGRLQQVGTPAQVYDKPANVFVAAFMGSPSMNLVPGGGVLDGEPGTVVGVRPEDLHLEPGADGRGGHVRIDAEVSVVESLGSETVLLVRSSDGTRLAVRTVPRSPYRSGDAVRLYVEPSRLHVFDEGSGCRR